MQRTSHHLQQLMASFSFSSIIPAPKYDVFLSFRGEDTRQNIVSHLYEAFSQKKIKTFIDDSPHKGIENFPSLLKPTENSKISVIIFSDGYACSRWCLEELEEIFKCKNTYGQIVIPVFYRVDPFDVRHQTGDFGQAFAQLEERFMNASEMLHRWRTALKEASNLGCFDSRMYSDEAQLIKEIVKEIMKRLQDTSPKYKLGWRHVPVFFLVMEAISVVLDVYGKSKKNFLLAAFVLSAFGFIITIYAFIRKRSTAAYKQRAERELAWVEVAFSVLQLVTLFIQYILAVARVKDIYIPSLFPLVFALIAVVFAFKNKQISQSQVQTCVMGPSVGDGYKGENSHITLPCPGLPGTISMTSHVSSQSGGGPSYTKEITVVKPISVLSSKNQLEPAKASGSVGSAATSLIQTVDMPQARKAALLRFLEKRKERVLSRTQETETKIKHQM